MTKVPTIIKNFKDYHALNGFTPWVSEFLWYDWFCSEKSLIARGARLAPIVAGLVETKKISMSNDYVFFKNNCPGSGGLYDSISICDKKTGTVKFWVGHKCPHVKPNKWYGRSTPMWTVVDMDDSNVDHYFSTTKDALKFLTQE